MAEIENIAAAKACKKGASKKRNTRVDLTPMVDLGFLLITFFVFTTTMATPTVMHINMPYNKVPPGDDVCASCALTVLLVKDNRIKYYEGSLGATTIVRQTSFTEAGIRNVILQKRSDVQKVRGTASDFVLIVKPTDESTFQNFVNQLDEVTINAIKHYYISEPDSADRRFILQQPN